MKSITDLAPQLAEIDLRCKANDFDGAARLLLDIDSKHLRRMAYYQTIIDLHEQSRPRKLLHSRKDSSVPNVERVIGLSLGADSL